ncbi:MAG: phospholipase D-like domain-containing protein [Bryobacteraceae bacterium]
MYAVFLVIAGIAIVIQSLLLYLAFFGPDLPYRIRKPITEPLDSEHFLRELAALADAQIQPNNRVEVLTNGGCFYEAELAAVRAARDTIHLEAYIFMRGEIAARFRDALTERARAGVSVKLILDYLGSLSTFRSYFRDLLDAGGLLAWYHPLRPSLLPQFNNRTHRELMVIDGRVGFIGGAGIADQWYKGVGGNPRWRDTMFRVEGPAVANLQSVFAENWLRSSGEILVDAGYFDFHKTEGTVRAMVVNSTPAAGSTRARILYQVLIAAARRSISITTPYFLPDRSAREEVIRAIRDRGVEVRILTPGKHSDHLLTRSSSRRLYGDLLKAGARIYEYQPAMIHAKIMLVDELWSVVGSTNFDHRSFGINDEVNLAAFDPGLAARLMQDFELDLADSIEVTYQHWRNRPFFRVYEWAGGLLENQE